MYGNSDIIQELRVEVASLRDEKKVFVNRHNAMQKQLEALTTRLQEAETTAVATKQLNLELIRKLEKLEDNDLYLQKKVTLQNSEADGLKKLNHDLITANKKLSKELTKQIYSLPPRRIELEKENEALKRKLHEVATTEVGELRIKTKHLEEENTELLNTLRLFQENLPEAQTAHQERIEEFMQKAEQSVPDYPVEPDKPTRLLRAKLILEEALETVSALGVNVTTPSSLSSPTVPIQFKDLQFFINPYKPFDMVEVVDGCCDISVVTIGTLSACGVKDAALLLEVDLSNLAKFGPGSSKRKDGKWLKPEGWTPPAISYHLRQQGWREPEDTQAEVETAYNLPPQKPELPIEEELDTIEDKQESEKDMGHLKPIEPEGDFSFSTESAEVMVEADRRNKEREEKLDGAKLRRVSSKNQATEEEELKQFVELPDSLLAQSNRVTQVAQLDRICRNLEEIYGKEKAEKMMQEHICTRCKGAGGSTQICPYAEEVDGIKEECNCCEECRQQCKDDI